MGLENKRLFCVRGAVCSENTKASITENTGLMLKTIFEKNGILKEDVVSIQFTLTPDLDELNPATALRHFFTNGEMSNIPLFCSAEPVIKNMMEKVVRTMVTVYLPISTKVENVYLNGAQALRPDLTGSKTRNC